jgi:hypothetical protein
VLRAVDHHRDVAALSGEARSAAARQDGNVVVAADLDGRDHVIGVARNDDADRDLPVVGGVRRVQRAVAGREQDLAAQGGPEV